MIGGTRQHAGTVVTEPGGDAPREEVEHRRLDQAPVQSADAVAPVRAAGRVLRGVAQAEGSESSGIDDTDMERGVIDHARGAGHGLVQVVPGRRAALAQGVVQVAVPDDPAGVVGGTPAQRLLHLSDVVRHAGSDIDGPAEIADLCQMTVAVDQPGQDGAGDVHSRCLGACRDVEAQVRAGRDDRVATNEQRVHRRILVRDVYPVCAIQGETVRIGG